MKQEPIAWQWLDTAIFRKKLPKNAEKSAWKPVYTHPQPKVEQEPDDLTIAYMSGFHDGKKAQPKREPLSLEQLREHWQVARVLDMTDAEIDFADYVLIARDVEALHGIKGEA